MITVSTGDWMYDYLLHCLMLSDILLNAIQNFRENNKPGKNKKKLNKFLNHRIPYFLYSIWTFFISLNYRSFAVSAHILRFPRAEIT